MGGDMVRANAATLERRAGVVGGVRLDRYGREWEDIPVPGATGITLSAELENGAWSTRVLSVVRVIGGGGGGGAGGGGGGEEVAFSTPVELATGARSVTIDEAELVGVRALRIVGKPTTALEVAGSSVRVAWVSDNPVAPTGDEIAPPLVPGGGGGGVRGGLVDVSNPGGGDVV